MSSYTAPAIHPRTRKIEQAEYLDDYYGRHRYGVRFSDGTVWPIDQIDRPSKPPSEPEQEQP